MFEDEAQGSPAGDRRPNAIDLHVGRRMAERRNGLGLNQSELGRALGITFQQIQKYERGVNRLSASKLWAAAECLQVSVLYFFEGLPEASRNASPPEAPEPLTRMALEIARSAMQVAPHRQRLIRDLLFELESERSNETGAA